jgi:hypothetical protein
MSSVIKNDKNSFCVGRGAGEMTRARTTAIGKEAVVDGAWGRMEY